MSRVAAGALPVAVNKAAEESHKSQSIINKINNPLFSFSLILVNLIHHRHHHHSSAERNQETASTYSLS